MVEQYRDKEIDKIEQKAIAKFDDLQEEMFEQILTVLDVEEFKKSYLLKAAKGSKREGHKYIMRTGSPGNYTYFYIEDGQLRFHNDFSKKIEGMKKKRGDIPFTGGFNHPEALKEYMKEYPGAIPNKGEGKKARRLMKKYLDKLRQGANITQGADRRKIVQEVKNLEERFLTGRAKPLTVSHKDLARKVVVKDSLKKYR